MTLADVLELLDLAQAHGVELWVDGGWAVDAALGEQTREHDDLDILIPREHEKPFADALRARGFRAVERPDTKAWNYVLGDSSDRRIDVHVMAPRSDGHWDLGPDGGPAVAVIPGEALSAHGVIGGRQVRCLTPEQQVRYHTGYEPDENDWHDVSALCSRFGIPLPDDYRRFVG